MDLIHATDEYKDQWNRFVAAHAADGGILQSWQWGDFWKSRDVKVSRLAGLGGDGQWRSVCLLTKLELPFEYSYFYAPRGPVVASGDNEAAGQMLEAIRETAGLEKSFMAVIEPAWVAAAFIDGPKPNLPLGQPDPVFQEALGRGGWRKGSHERQPRCSFIMPISQTEEELLAAMKPKTRYNLGLAQKHGVQARVSTEVADVEIFWELAKQTSRRDKFSHHPKDHYKKMLETLGADGSLRLVIAEYQGKAIAANLLGIFGTTATYLHGASADLYREVMAPYSLQWESIRLAKQAGCVHYDFGGVNARSYQNPAWEGITRFKLGFSPATEPTEFIGSYELVLNPVVYAGYSFVKQIRG